MFPTNVFPAPTSPVTSTMPLRCWTVYIMLASASAWMELSKKNLSSHVMANGGSRNP